MAKLDPFSAQIVSLVRGMPDEAILELVRNQLGAIGLSAPAKRGAAAKAASPIAPVAAPKKRGRASKAEPARVAKAATMATKKATKAAKPSKAGAPKKRGGRRASPDKAKLLESVERLIRSSKGMSASQIAAKTKLPQSRITAAVRELKDAKRIFQGGDRRFARYAGDRDTAIKASLHARNNAAGPKRS